MKRFYLTAALIAVMALTPIAIAAAKDKQPPHKGNGRREITLPSQRN